MTCSYHSHYPTFTHHKLSPQVCGDSCSHPMGKLEVHALLHLPLVRMALLGDRGFLPKHQNHVTQNVRAMSLTNQIWQARLEKWSKEINSEQQYRQEWCITTLGWKFESNRTSIDKDICSETAPGVIELCQVYMSAMAKIFCCRFYNFDLRKSYVSSKPTE